MIMSIDNELEEKFHKEKAAIDWDTFYKDKKDYSGVIHGDAYSTFKKLQMILEECNQIESTKEETDK